MDHGALRPSLSIATYPQTKPVFTKNKSQKTKTKNIKNPSLQVSIINYY